MTYATLHTQIGLFLQVRESCYLASYNQFTSSSADWFKVSFGCTELYGIVHVCASYSQPLVKDAQIKLTNLVYQMISDGNLKFAQLLRNALVNKVQTQSISEVVITYIIYVLLPPH